MHRAPGIAGPLQFLPPPREPPNQEGRPAPLGPLLLLQQVSKPAVDILWSHSRSAWLWLIIGPNVVVIECCKDAAYWKNVIRNELAIVWWRHVAKFIYCNSLLKECDQKGDMSFSKPMLTLILGWYVVFKVYRDSIVFSYYLGSSGTTTPVAQQNGTVPATNGTGGATHSDESDGQTGPAGHPTQAQQNQSNSTEPLPAGYGQLSRSVISC